VFAGEGSAAEETKGEVLHSVSARNRAGDCVMGRRHGVCRRGRIKTPIKYHVFRNDLRDNSKKQSFTKELSRSRRGEEYFMVKLCHR